MSCPSCGEPSGIGVGAVIPPIGVKIGAPLSTACERATVVGSIPVVLRLWGVTLVNGAIAQSVNSNAGLCNSKAFFTYKQGCYANRNARSACSSC